MKLEKFSPERCAFVWVAIIFDDPWVVSPLHKTTKMQGQSGWFDGTKRCCSCWEGLVEAGKLPRKR